MEKVYTAGPMSGPDYHKTFGEMALLLRAAGYEPLNHAATIPQDADRATAIKKCFAMIDASDYAYFMPGWKTRRRVPSGTRLLRVHRETVLLWSPCHNQG